MEMLRVPTQEELSRDAQYVRDALRVNPSTPVGQILTALRIPGEWAAPCVERALQYAFRCCYDGTLRQRILQATAQWLSGEELSDQSEMYLLFELNAGVMAARLHDPPPVVPAAFRVPGTQLALLATRFLIWKTKQTSPHIQLPYHETLRFLRALKFHDPSETLGARFPRYHVFLAIVVTVVNNALDSFAASLGGQPYLSLGLRGEIPGGSQRNETFFSMRRASFLNSGQQPDAIPRGHRRSASDSSTITVACAPSSSRRRKGPRDDLFNDNDLGSDATLAACFEEAGLDASGDKDLDDVVCGDDEDDDQPQRLSEGDVVHPTTSTHPLMQQQQSMQVTVRTPEFKLQAGATNLDAPLEVKALLEQTQFDPKVTQYIETYVPTGLMLGALTADGEVKPYRAGVDDEAWAVPPAEIQPLRFRVAVYAQSAAVKLADRTLVARYTNSMTIWPTIRDPYRLNPLIPKMKEHTKAVFQLATNTEDAHNPHACAVFASTSSLNSTAVTSDPTRGALSQQVVQVLVRLAKTDPDFEGRCHVKIYVPDHIANQGQQPAPGPQQQLTERPPLPPATSRHAHHPSLPTHPLFRPQPEVNYISDEATNLRVKRRRHSGDLPPLAGAVTSSSSSTSTEHIDDVTDDNAAHPFDEYLKHWNVPAPTSPLNVDDFNDVAEAAAHASENAIHPLLQPLQ